MTPPTQSSTRNLDLITSASPGAAETSFGLITLRGLWGIRTSHCELRPVTHRGINQSQTTGDVAAMARCLRNKLTRQALGVGVTRKALGA